MSGTTIDMNHMIPYEIPPNSSASGTWNGTGINTRNKNEGDQDECKPHCCSLLIGCIEALSEVFTCFYPIPIFHIFLSTFLSPLLGWDGIAWPSNFSAMHVAAKLGDATRLASVGMALVWTWLWGYPHGMETYGELWKILENYDWLEDLDGFRGTGFSDKAISWNSVPSPLCFDIIDIGWW